MAKAPKSSTSLPTKRHRTATPKAHLDELFRRALTEGPQYVDCEGKKAVVLSAEEYERLTQGTRRPESLAEFFAKSPLAGVDLEHAFDRIEEIRKRSRKPKGASVKTLIDEGRV